MKESCSTATYSFNEEMTQEKQLFVLNILYELVSLIHSPLSGVAGWNAAGDIDVCVVSSACCQVEIFAAGWSLTQRSPTDCGV
jgi:hypothetical protein